MPRHLRVVDRAETPLRHVTQPANLRVLRLQQVVLAEVQLLGAHRAIPRRREQEFPLPALRQGLHHEAGPGRAHAAAAQEPSSHLSSMPAGLSSEVQPEEAR